MDINELKYFNKKTIQLKCCVCGGKAFGFNFNQITCESCKAFFRRNAFKSEFELKCRYSGCCLINVETRRQCNSCRLKKCFLMNMKKEWIRTDQEKQLRSLKKYYKETKNYEKHSQITIVQRKKKRFIPIEYCFQQFNQFQMKIENLPNNIQWSKLNENEYSIINNINQSYDLWKLTSSKNLIDNYSIENSTIFDFLNGEQKVFESLIEFYKRIPQFQQINLHDQILLIKCNLNHLVHIDHVLKENFHESSSYEKLMTHWIHFNFHQNMSKTRENYNHFIENPLVLKLTLVTMIFTINLSSLPIEQFSNEFFNQKQLNEIQEFYLLLLMKYLRLIYGEKRSIQLFSILIFQHLQYQQIMNYFEMFVFQKKFFEHQHHPHPHLHPLIQSILRLT